MMAKFEEKTFESYFNTELDRRASIYFPFGQVQEGGIGADAAAMSGSRRLWRLLGYPYIFRMPFDGIFLREVADDIERSLEMHVNNIPDMKVNHARAELARSFSTEYVKSRYVHSKNYNEVRRRSSCFSLQIN